MCILQQNILELSHPKMPGDSTFTPCHRQQNCFNPFRTVQFRFGDKSLRGGRRDVDAGEDTLLLGKVLLVAYLKGTQ